MDDSICAGFVSGIVQTLVGHPLDTMKVWRQQNITKPIHFISLFSGMKYPLLTSPILASAQFTTASLVSENMKFRFGYTQIQSDTIGGLCTGVVSGLLTSPIDKYKILQQVKSSRSRYGLFSCIVREIPACGIYFGSYSMLREHEIPIVVAGATSGSLSWLLTYPLDIAKTQIQSGDYSNFRAVYTAICNGTVSITHGLGFCLARACLINSIGFVVYEKCLSR